MTIWQQLGAFIYNTGDCDLNRLKRFHSIGGRWVVVVLIGDDARGPANLEDLPRFKADCKVAGIRCGLHANGWGEPANELAIEIATMAKRHALSPVILDLEASYKNENAPKMPDLLAACRFLMSGRSIGVTSYGFCDRQMIWNGRTLDPPRSFFDLKVRFIPQWYPQYNPLKYTATYCMGDLRRNGAIDGNIADATAPGGRGVPESYVHGVLEVTGIDKVDGAKSDLAKGLTDLAYVKRFWGFTWGFSVWTLESMPEGDWALLEAERGRLFKT